MLMAFVSDRKTNRGVRWRLQYRVGEKQHVLSFDDEQIARRWCDAFNDYGPARAMALMDAEVERSQGVPTVREVVEDHIAKLTGITEGTRADYRRLAGWDINERIGDLPITRLAGELPEWINGLTSPDRVNRSGAKRALSGKTVANLHSLLSDACASAVKAGLLTENPCRGVRLPRSIKVEMVCLTHGEFLAVRSRLHERWHPLADLLAGTGLRWGEATALQVGDVDFANGCIHVERAWKHHRREIGPPKTGASVRKAAFGPRVAESIRTVTEGRQSGAFLITTRWGESVPGNSFRGRHWNPAVAGALEAGEIRRKPRVHDLRHSYASWALAAGVPVNVVQRQLGHESIKTTVDTYGHVQPEALAAAASAVEAGFSG